MGLDISPAGDHWPLRGHLVTTSFKISLHIWTSNDASEATCVVGTTFPLLLFIALYESLSELGDEPRGGGSKSLQRRRSD